MNMQHMVAFSTKLAMICIYSQENIQSCRPQKHVRKDLQTVWPKVLTGTIYKV